MSFKDLPLVDQLRLNEMMVDPLSPAALLPAEPPSEPWGRRWVATVLITGGLGILLAAGAILEFAQIGHLLGARP